MTLGSSPGVSSGLSFQFSLLPKISVLVSDSHSELAHDQLQTHRKEKLLLAGSTKLK